MGVKTDYSVTRKDDDKVSSDYLEKVLDERLKEKVKTLSKDKESRPREEQYIEEFIKADLLKALYAKGYYNARIAFIKGDEELSGKYQIDYGPQFQIGSIAMKPDEYIKNLDNQNIKAGMILDAESVLVAQSNLSKNIQKDKCYFTLDVKNEVYLDQKNHKGQVTFLVDAGKEAHFGQTSFEGNETVKESYLRKLVPWKDGDCFRRYKIEGDKTSLL